MFNTSFVFLLALLISSSKIQAQNDFSELKSDIIQAETEVKRIEGIITLGSVYNRTQLDSITYFADSLSSLTYQNQEFAQAGKQFLEAIVTYHQGNLELAIEQLEISRRYFEQNGPKKIHLRVLNLLGIAYTRTNEVEQALEIQDLILSLSGDDPEYVQDKIAAYGNQANSYRRIGEFAKAIYSLEKTIALSKEDTVAPIALSYLNMGQMLLNLRLYDRALDAYRNININTLPSESVKGAVLSGIANAYLSLEKLDSAYFYYKMAFESTNASGNWQQTLIPQIEMAKIALARGDADLSNEHIRTADTQITKYPYAPPFFIDLYLVKIQYLMMVGKLNEAVSVANEFETYVNDNSIAHLSKDGFRIISELYEKLGNVETALRYQKIHNDLGIMPQRIGENARIAEQRSQLALLEKDEIIEQGLSEKAFYQGLTFQIVALAIVLLGISIFLYKHYKREKRDNVIKDNELKQLKQKLTQLAKESIRPESAEHISLKSKALIKLSDLSYISSDGPYLEFHLRSKSNPEIDRNSLKNVLEELPSKKFIQVHRSHIVNVDFIKSIYSNKVVLTNGEELSVSRSFKDKLDLLLSSG